MKKLRQLVVLIALILGGTNYLFSSQLFEVNLNDRTDDTFKVTLTPEHLSPQNDVFQFASTAPGTYEEMDIGRFVHDFKAYDGAGKEIPCDHSSVNQWTISHPSDVAKITYAVDDIWKTKLTDHRVYDMAGTTLSDDFVMVNGQGVFGYFAGMQSEPIKIKFDYPQEWNVGTALLKDGDGFYEAEDFDKVVDSPVFLGKLSTAETSVGETKIAVYTYSITGLITSYSLLASLQSILKAESDFTRGLPVDHYAFLFYFGKTDAGAWEHSFSSEYVMHEDTLTPAYAGAIVSTVAHEFFHVNVPLNLHSELVEHFNFVKPVMSQHLWLYEGTTEWAAHMLQLRDSLLSLDQYLKILSGKFNANDNFDQTLSLTSLGVHSTELQNQYGNIYSKGALVSALLDIRLLELSHGTSGLRELFLKLAKEYGKKRAFGEDGFFDKIVSMTYPEIGDFIDRYIKGTEKLPAKEYYSWLGIDYKQESDPDTTKSSLRIGIRGTFDGFVVTKVFPDSKSNLLEGDTIMAVDSEKVTFDNMQKILGGLMMMKPGGIVRLTVKRGDKEVALSSLLLPRITRHVFSVDPNPTPDQLALRQAWMRNL